MKEHKPTMSEAHDILKTAKEEAKDRGRGLKTRQAAEKVWLAASTAASAMAGGQTINLSSHVFNLFERAWGAEGRDIAKNIEAALHQGCFYRNSLACDGKYVEGHVEKLGRLLHKPIRDRAIRQITSKKNGRR